MLQLGRLLEQVLQEPQGLLGLVPQEPELLPVLQVQQELPLPVHQSHPVRSAMRYPGSSGCP